jgi:aminopeptidase N
VTTRSRSPWASGSKPPARLDRHKATFTFDVTVPDDIQAIANGQLVSHNVDRGKGTSNWVWEETEQMATYLATLSTGRFTILRDETETGIPIINAVQPDQLTEQSRFDSNYARDAGSSFWENTVFDPGVENQYPGPTVYTRGAMTLHALRGKIGDNAFFRTLKAYVKTFSGGVASTQDFVSIAERESGTRLDEFFDVGLYESGKPADW